MGNELAPDDPAFEYHEFAMLDENCAEYSLDWPRDVSVSRTSVEIPAGGEGSCKSLSAIRWATGAVEIVFLHGGAQNAHTWDTTVLALGTELGVTSPNALAIDLPGHGSSGWRADGSYDPHSNAESVIEMLSHQLTSPVVLVGMSLGGLTAVRVAALRPDLVSRLVIVDITPGVTREKAKEIHDFVAGPQEFSNFADIFQRTVEFNPTRSESSLRRGILHNAHRREDGSWVWNYDRNPMSGEGFPSSQALWGDVATTHMPYLMLKATDSPVVDEADLAELEAVRADVRLETVSDAGHSIQGDQPLVLAKILKNELELAQS